MSEIRDFARLLKVGQFSMLAVYGDESGKHESSKCFVLTGIRANVNTWERGSRVWANALKSLGIKRFHASECENKRKAFEGISNRDRDEIQNVLIEAAGKINFLVLSVGISWPMHSKAVGPLADQRFNKYKSTPYHFLFSSVVSRLVEHKHGMGKKDRIAFFFDRQDEFKGTAEKNYHAMKHDPRGAYSSRMGVLSFLDKDDPEAIPLQIADLVAYESYKFLTDSSTVINGQKVASRWQGRKLFDPIHSKGILEIREWNAEGIEYLHELRRLHIEDAG